MAMISSRLFGGDATSPAKTFVLVCIVTLASPISLDQRALQLQAGLTESQFDHLVLHFYGGKVTAIRQMLASQLAARVQDAARVCGLDKDQRAKLLLAGQGDLNRFFDDYNAVKAECLKLNVQNLNQDVLSLIQPLQQRLAVGFYHEHSLFAKCLRNVLTSEQLAEYEAAVRQRNAYRNRAKVSLAVAMMEDAVPLDDKQREALINLLAQKVSFDGVASPNDYPLVLQTMSLMPKEELQPLFDETQWEMLQAMMRQTRLFADPPAMIFTR